MPALRLDKSSGKLNLSERDIQRTCEELLQYDGWRIFRLEQNYSERKRKVVGEKGAPDALCLRYTTYATDPGVLFIEWKRIKGKAGNDQLKWHTNERLKGAITWIAGLDFPATIEGFKAHYMESGLQRRK